MPVYRGPNLTSEEIDAAVRQAAAEMIACKTIEELRDVWKRYFVPIGHKALGRMFIAECRNIEGVANKRAAVAKQ